MNDNVYLRFSTRHISQLGQQLVTDYVTAISELIKNSYDADSEAVKIYFENIKSDKGRIIIFDTGSGFSDLDIKNKWAIVGTSNKVGKPFSSMYSRRVTGKKGIGRFAVERLAQKFTLFSITKDGVAIKYYVDWNRFEGIDVYEIARRLSEISNGVNLKNNSEYLRYQINNLIFSDKTIQSDKEICIQLIQMFDKNKELSEKDSDIILQIFQKYQYVEKYVDEIATRLTHLSESETKTIKDQILDLYEQARIEKDIITGSIIILEELRDAWKEKDLNKLDSELSQLINPLKNDNKFAIFLDAKEYNFENEKISSKILNLNYAHLYGSFNNNASKLSYTLDINKKDESIHDEEELNQIGICGDFNFNIYYFVRDSSLKNSDFSIEKARKIIDNYSGVKIYRDNFRVKPYGDIGNDWLLLNQEKIVETHGYFVANNQLIGNIEISSENNPLLVDSTNREAIIENDAFAQMRSIIKLILDKISTYRYDVYQEELKNNPLKKIEEKRAKLINNRFTKINKISSEIKADLSRNNILNIELKIDQLYNTVLIETNRIDELNAQLSEEYTKQIENETKQLNLYKNLATLGIFAGSFGHETDENAARVLSNIAYIKNSLSETNDSLNNAIQDIFDDGERIANYSELLLKFLLKKNRDKPVKLNFKKVIDDVITMYDKVINSYKIVINTKEVDDFETEILMYRIDFESILINLLTNAFESLKKITKTRIINITLKKHKNQIILMVEDSGLGIPEEIKEKIFLPLFSTKKDVGIGLGLTIVKDIVNSNEGNIYVLKSDHLGGAKFEIVFSEGSINE